MITKSDIIQGEPWHPTDRIYCIAQAQQISRLPLCIGISEDNRTVNLSDNVDYIHRLTLSRRDILALADEIRQLADLMVD